MGFYSCFTFGDKSPCHHIDDLFYCFLDSSDDHLYFKMQTSEKYRTAMCNLTDRRNMNCVFFFAKYAFAADLFAFNGYAKVIVVSSCCCILTDGVKVMAVTIKFLALP